MKWSFGKKALAASVIASAVASAVPAFATSPYLNNGGFTSNVLPANDDSSTGQVDIGFSINFFGNDYTQLYVNNNGNVTFNGASSTFTPFNLTGDTSNPIIAPYFGDVDTRGSASGLVTYGTDTVNGHAAFGVDWPSVGYYDEETDKLNTFQLVLINRNDVGAGDFDIEFNYSQIQWEAGDVSGGTDGLGGTTTALVGYSSGTGTFFELPGSLVAGTFLDTGTAPLITGTNDGVPGQLYFEVRGGVVSQLPPPSGVPLPSAAWSSILVLGGLGMFKLMKSRKLA